MEAFVYCWTDHKTKKLYIGSHKGSVDDGYVCSSKYMMIEYKKRPFDFTRHIVAEGNVKDIRKLESKILQAANARIDEQFYNKHDNDGFFFDGWKEGEFSEEHRKNMSISASKRQRTSDHLMKLQEGRRNSKNSEEHNRKISEKNTGRKSSKETIEKAKITRRQNNDNSKLASNAGKASQQKRKETGYYQSDEWKMICAKAWQNRRNNKLKKEGLVNGD
jgi:hypothetical protein